MKLVSVIIVNYNTRDVLLDCIRNLHKSDYKNLEIIVVDNGSSDGSYDAVKENFSYVIAIKAENRGISAGYNLGIKNSKGDYLLYMGSDAFPKESTISGMVDYFEANKDVGAATCKLILRDGTLDPDAHRGFPTPWAALTHFSKLNKVFPKSKTFNQYFMGYENMDIPHEIDLCISHFMLMRREILDKIGLWDEDYFVYGEDVDMCYRIKQAGYKLMYLPQFESLHYKGVSVGIRKETGDVSKASKETRLKMSKARTQAMRLFYEKHYSKKYPKFATGFILFAINILEKIRTSRIK